MRSRRLSSAFIACVLAGCGGRGAFTPQASSGAPEARERILSKPSTVFSLVGGLPTSGPASTVQSLTIIPYGTSGKAKIWNLNATQCLPATACTVKLLDFAPSGFFVVRSYRQKNGTGKLLSTTLVNGSKAIGLTLHSTVAVGRLAATDLTPAFGKKEQILLAGIGQDSSGAFIIGPAPYDTPIGLKLQGTIHIASTKVTSAMHPFILTYKGGYQYEHIAVASRGIGASITIRPRLGTALEQLVPSTPSALAAASDGSVWFADASNCGMTRILSDVTTQSFPVPSGFACPGYVTTGPDGNVWFTGGNGTIDYGQNGVGYVTSAGTVTDYPASDALDVGPLTTGSDGRLWIVDQDGEIYTATTSGVVEPAANWVDASNIQAIVSGPDGNLWVPYNPWGSKTAFAVFSPDEALVKYYQTNVAPPIAVRGSYVYAMTQKKVNRSRYQSVGVWTAAGKIVDTYPAADGAVAGSQFAIAPDGSLWYGVGTGANTVLGRISATGEYCELSVPYPSIHDVGFVKGLVFGGDGNLYYTRRAGYSNQSEGYLGKITLPSSS